MSNDNLAISPTGELGDALSTNLHIINRTQELIGELNALIGKISGQYMDMPTLSAPEEDKGYITHIRFNNEVSATNEEILRQQVETLKKLL